jgi:hypothetical protein
VLNQGSAGTAAQAVSAAEPEGVLGLSTSRGGRAEHRR